MAGVNRNGLYNDKRYRIRCMRSLLAQIKQDHAHFCDLCKRLEKGETEVPLIEELQRVLSWLKQGLSTFKEIETTGIEGVSWGEIERIARDIKDKEMHLKLFLYSISMETDKIHDSPSLPNY